MAQNPERDMCHIPYWVNFMAQNAVCDGVTFLIGSTLGPKTPFVTCVTFLIGPTCWPKFFFVTVSHSLLGQLYGPNRDQKLFKNSNTVKKLSKTAKIEFVTVSHSLLGQLDGPKRRL